MSRSLKDLDERFRPLAEELLLEAAKAGIHLTVIDTRRTEAEHQANLAKGVSWIKRSKHIDGLAIDVCPTRLLHLKFWAPENPDWQQLGEIGKSLGLRWGGDWHVKDLGHFEYQGEA